MGKYKPYSGLRITSDYVDCAMPIAIDTRNICTYRCNYCFSNFLKGHTRSSVELRTLRPSRIRNLIDSPNRIYKYFIDKRQPLQIGALTDPFDNAELKIGNTSEILKILNEYKYPTRISTKGGKALYDDKYLKLISEGVYWFTFSIIHNKDNKIELMDLGAPNTTERLKMMKNVTDAGARATLRLRPIIPGFTDGIDELIELSKAAGAESVSSEVLFFDTAPSVDMKMLYYNIEKLSDRALYSEMVKASPKRQKCLRTNREWKAGIFYPIYKKVRELGMLYCQSDPIFKELNDSINCCGIPEEDPVWGNFSRHGFHVLVADAYRAYKENGEVKCYTWRDYENDDVRAFKDLRFDANVFPISSSPIKHDYYTELTNYHDLRNKWNNTKHPRGLYIYFDGILKPVDKDDDGDVVYEFDPSRTIENFI